MTIRITIPQAACDAHRAAILAPLRAYNLEHAGDPQARPVAILLTDDSGNDVGGLWGKIGYDWLFVELLAVPAALRGQSLGSALMHEAERIAREAECVGMWLDTFEFQARGFYGKLGFELFGTLEDHPLGARRFFLKKRFGGIASRGV